MSNRKTIYLDDAIDAIRASTSKYTGFMEMEMYTDDDAVEAIEGVPSAEPDLSEHSVWFRIGETLVDVSKEHISAEDGIKKIREIMVRMKKPSVQRKGEE